MIIIPKWHVDQIWPTNQILSDSLFSDLGMSLSKAKTKTHLMSNQYNFAIRKCQRRFMCPSHERNLLGIPDGDGGDQLHQLRAGKSQIGRELTFVNKERTTSNEMALSF